MVDRFRQSLNKNHFSTYASYTVALKLLGSQCFSVLQWRFIRRLWETSHRHLSVILYRPFCRSQANTWRPHSTILLWPLFLAFVALNSRRYVRCAQRHRPFGENCNSQKTSSLLYPVRITHQVQSRRKAENRIGRMNRMFGTSRAAADARLIQPRLTNFYMTMRQFICLVECW